MRNFIRLFIRHIPTCKCHQHLIVEQCLKTRHRFTPYVHACTHVHTCVHACTSMYACTCLYMRTSMYALTFRVRVTTPPQYGRNGTAHAAGASMLSPARGVFAGVRSVRVWHACGGPGGLPLRSVWHFDSVAIATQPVRRLQICPIVHN